MTSPTSLTANRLRPRVMPPPPPAPPPPPEPLPSPPPVAPPEPALDWAGRLRWGAAILAVSGLLLWLTWSLFSMLFASAVLAYLLDPVLSRLERRGITRPSGVVAVAVIGTLLALLAILVVIPTFFTQISHLAANLQPYITNLAAQIGPVRSMVEERLGTHIPVDLDELATVAPALIQQISPETRATVTGLASRLVNLVSTGGIGAVATLFQLTLLPPFVFFLARDWPELMKGIEGLVPPRLRDPATVIARRIDERIFAFVKGQLSVATALGILYSIGLLIAGIDLAIPVGLLSGVLFLVPYLGGVVGVVLSGTLALLKFGVDWHVLACVATFVVGQGVEGLLLTPLLVGDRVGLHPMVVIVALIVGGNLLGIWGLVLAIPLTAVLAVLGDELVKRYRGSAFFRG